MAPFPPPSPAPSDRSDRAARLEALAARRAVTTGETDDRAARLERLAQRNRTTAATEPTERPRRRSRRAHPARGARRAALGMSVLTTAGLAGFFAVTGGSSAAETATIVSASSSVRPVGATAEPATTAAATPTVVDGGVFHNKWGDVQVRATFTEGDLVDVVALRSPDDRGQSVRINDAALPRLTTEALSAQTASVHTVSGATYTSDGYRKSLQSAIDVARQAGVTTIS